MMKTICFFILSFVILTTKANSQITITPVQAFNFGTFYQGYTGGTVDISVNGSRSSTGDIILMNTSLDAAVAIFEIEAPVGSVISILQGPDALLTGSNGGTLKLQLGAANLSSPFTTTAIPPNYTRLQIGGKLIISSPAASPPGVYTGTFNITLNHE